MVSVDGENESQPQCHTGEMRTNRRKERAPCTPCITLDVCSAVGDRHA
jgi:hypothetical protein